MGAKFRGITSEGSRRNFRGFNFRDARTHGEARRYRYSASGNFCGFYFAEADLSTKNAKFCTTRKFPATRCYTHVTCPNMHATHVHVYMYLYKHVSCGTCVQCMVVLHGQSTLCVPYKTRCECDGYFISGFTGSISSYCFIACTS